MRKIVFLEGRIDFFYIRKAYELAKHSDNILYIPCGGASEIWPVIDAITWTEGKKHKYEWWLDNDPAGRSAAKEIKGKYPFVKIRVIAKDVPNGSIEDVIGFLHPTTYKKYNEVKHSKSKKSKYRDMKKKLLDNVLNVKKINDVQKERIENFFKKFEIK